MTEGNNTDKLLYTLAYPIGIIGLVLILTKQEDEEARYHGFNSLFFWIGILIVNMALGFVPIIGWLASGLVTMGAIVYSIVLAIKVNNGERPVIPVVTDFASKYV